MQEQDFVPRIEGRRGKARSLAGTGGLGTLITLRTRKMLWGQSASRCSYPDCRCELVEDATAVDVSSIVGDEAHIVAREPSGPRGESNLSADERDDYPNLILLCKIHHKLIDDQPNTYTVASLHDMKKEHLDWVSRNLETDRERQADDEDYASYIDKWVELSGADEWDVWSSWVLEAAQPRIVASRMEQLEELGRYLLSRIWPHRYSALEDAFANFARVANDFRSVFMKRAVKWDGDGLYYETEAFYRHGEHHRDAYQRRLDLYNYHVDLVQDLVFELTRAANDLCDKVRASALPSFRVREGALLVTRGPGMDLKYATYRLEYRDQSRYPGLREFMTARVTRDVYVGEGVNESYFRAIPEEKRRDNEE